MRGKPASPLVGRVDELSELLSVVQRASGGGQIVTLEGEAGIGKTSLLQELLDRAARQGFRAFAGGADELERHRPFGAISECLGLGRRGQPANGLLSGEEERRARIAQLLSGAPAGAGAMAPPVLPEAPDVQFRIVDALADLVEHLCAAGPIILAIEDLQWADPSSLLALARLAREIPALPVALVCTRRPQPRSVHLAAFLGDLRTVGAHAFSLDRLDGDAVAALVGARPGPGLLAHIARAGGNPFFATELVASLQREGAIRYDGGEAEVAAGPGAVPASLTTTIRRRLSFLPDRAMQMLQVASVLGSSFAVADLAAVLERPPADLAPELGAAVAAGVLREQGRTFTFGHDLIREALYSGMPGALRHALHLSAARALAEVGLPPEEVAEHVVRGAAPGDLAAVAWLRSAAQQAATRSPGIAAELCQRALEIALAGAGAPELRDETVTDLALYLLSSGRLRDAERICRTTLGRDHAPAIGGRLRLCLVQALVGQGRLADCLAEIDAAAASPGIGDRERARLWAWASTCRIIIWDVPRATQDAHRALAACREIGDELGETIALAGLAALANLSGDLQGALRLADEALAGARRSRSAEARRLQLTLMHSLLLIDVDRLDDAQLALRRGRVARERRGARWNLASYHFVSAIGRFWSGEWDEAIAQFDTAMDFSEGMIVRQGQLVGHALRSMIALHRGDLATADREAAAAEADLESAGPQWRPDWMLLARALILEAGGAAPAALRLLAKAWETCEAGGAVAEYPVIGPDLVRLAVGCGESILAEEVTASLEALAARAGVASVDGAALRCRHLVGGSLAPALAAIAAYRRSPRRRELALACEDAARALATVGRRDEARGHAVEAIEIFGALDARRDLARAQLLLPSDPAAGDGRPRAPRPAFGWKSLTRSEMAVAALVADGLSNPEIAERLFISRRTAQSHVSHALEKLGLSSRVELAVAARRQGML